MNSFWQSLHRLTQGQLFAHGYLSPRTVAQLAAKSETPPPHDCSSGSGRRKAVRWPRLATPH
jgi:hypothetical protein